jgi:hypothetical protein
MNTGYAPVEVVDPMSTPEQVLNNVSSGLDRSAIRLGAEAVGVLLTAGSRVEITYFWSAAGDELPPAPSSNTVQSGVEALKASSGFIAAGSPLAQFLREALSRRARSFLLFPRKIRQSGITVVFCFAAPQPGHREVPEAVRETLDLIGLAMWSVKEVERLQVELRIVASRLAGRKLVERAKGVLQADEGFTEERAYEYLRRISRQRRITLVELAEEIVRERAGPDPSRLSVTKPQFAS